MAMTEDKTSQPAPRPTAEPSRPHWLIRPKTIRLLWVGGLAVLALLVAAERQVPPHPNFDIDGTFGFYAWYGFAACVAMIVGAKALGFILGRKDTYYDD